MLESYVTPILMSYVNRYIKNLKPSDLQLSLWGGDVVLSKLELKLDVLEQELKLPFTFLSGHIHELRIHVPWTKLGSESVVITINTMECILKLKDGAQDDHESCGSSSSRSNTESAKSPTKPRKIQQTAPTDPDLPPGYVQSLIRRVVNNVNIVVNNLILKYVEDDIVLSVNITCAECYTVDEYWDRAFMDISASELVLRKVINFSDCTVCLDKRNASGKIEFYQDPLLYKCSFRTRLHFTYDSLNSKMPAIIKIHTMVDSLKLSLTDQQLPMFIRIMQLGIALYYGELGNSKEGGTEDPPTHAKDIIVSMPGSEEELVAGTQYPAQEMYSVQDDDDQQGWVSWAWSFVPAIVSYSSDEDGEDGYAGMEEGNAPQGPRSKMSKDPIICIGFYCTKATVTFKLTEMQAESSYYSPQKVKSREVLRWEQEGTTIEVLMKGEPFFDCQVGFVGSQAMCLKGIMGIKDFEENANRTDSEACFFTCGENLTNKGNTYLTNSLFDYRSPENNGIRAEFILVSSTHKETYTEIAGMQRFGALYMDYLYTMESASGKGSLSHQEFPAVKTDETGSLQEMSIKRLVIGPIDLRLDSSSVHRILKMVACSFDHEYEAYSCYNPILQEECKTLPSPEEVASLEEYIPTRLTCVTLLKFSITITMAEFNLLGQLMPIIMGQKHSVSINAASFQPIRPLPALRILADKINVEHSVPMYAEQLVQTVSSLSQPSDNLLHHCYAHCYLKVFGFQAGLTYLDNKGSYCSPVSVVPAFSTALYGKLLRLPQQWTQRTHVPVTEYIFELPNLTIEATRAQTLLLQVILQSWSYSTNSSSPAGLSEVLLSEVFPSTGVKSKNALPTLEGSIQNVELKFCSTSLVKCVSGTLGSIKICAKAPGEVGKEKLIPLIQGPSDTKDLHRSKWLKESRRPESLLGPDLIAFTIQVPEQMDYCHSSAMASYMDREFTTGFIDVYRASECLWKVRSKDFSNRQKKDQAYRQLVEYSKAHNSDADLLWAKKKIANLRTVFKKEHTRVIESQRSGAGTDDVYQPTLWYYEQMKFLLEREAKLHGQGSLDKESPKTPEEEGTLNPESTPEVMNTSATEATELELSGEESAPSRSTAPPRRRQKNSSLSSDSASSSTVQFIQRAEEMLNRPPDFYRQFSNTIESQIRVMPETVFRTFRRIVFDVLRRAEDNDLSDDLDLMSNPVRRARNAPQSQYPYPQPYYYPPGNPPPQRPFFSPGPPPTPTLPTPPTSTLSTGLYSAMLSTQLPPEDEATFFNY